MPKPPNGLQIPCRPDQRFHCRVKPSMPSTVLYRSMASAERCIVNLRLPRCTPPLPILPHLPRHGFSLADTLPDSAEFRCKPRHSFVSLNVVSKILHLLRDFCSVLRYATEAWLPLHSRTGRITLPAGCCPTCSVTASFSLTPPPPLLDDAIRVFLSAVKSHFFNVVACYMLEYM